MFTVTRLLQSGDFVMQRNRITGVQVFSSNALRSKLLSRLPAYDFMNNRKCTNANLSNKGTACEHFVFTNANQQTGGC
jgi:hypothetical protein